MSTVEIPLRRRDGSVRAVALVDAEDAERVLVHNWCFGGHGYVTATTRADGKQTNLRLHRVVMGLEPGDPREVDHRDGNRLDNRRSNLRVCTRALNAQNITAGGHRDSVSRYRGVAWHKGAGKWMASACIDGKQHYLGLFIDEERAGDVAAAFRAQHMPFSNEGTEAA